MSTLVMGRTTRQSKGISQTDLLAPNPQSVVIPDSGAVVEFGCIIQTTVTTGGTLTLSAGGVNVGGAVIVVPNGAAKGTILKATLPVGDQTRNVTKDEAYLITPAGFATAGAVETWVDTNTGGLTPSN